jgi:hypothetical protein
MSRCLGACRSERPPFVVRLNAANSAAKTRRAGMKYAFTIYNDDARRQEATPEQRQQMSQAYMELSQEMEQKGVLVAGEGLHPTSTATTVRVRDGQRDVTDGPFAETKEQLGGFFVLDVKDLDEAIEWAARIPGAQIGSVEIRPVLVFDDAGNIVEPATA